MEIQYLIDENLSFLYQEQLHKSYPDLRILNVGQPPAPPNGTLDPEILVWCEQNNFILVTNNRKSMPGHLADHLAGGGEVPGILTFRKKFSIANILESLILIAEAGDPIEYRNCISYIPL
ncbi:DUF5615 family PIN-like protein [Roseofilum casamattae]|uniref:DUF5615 family PIN-like protein n=1 Tax=Roseofilum casamattae BLCC-M143 TaxID=3022442 RepID=A0ABT7BRW6_9CYAN|nr:DUF5615 family PIN-like protein [Roseofilum casamattae]MDJ1181934.1 DUF5615 family PIN-like protein [Roseofilum casamattae BLCC-M143]